MAIGAIVSIIVYPIAGLLFEYATVETGEKLGMIFVAICLLYTVLSILQLIACIKGVKGCNNKSAAPDLKKWGKILIIVSLVSGIASFVNSLTSGQAVVSSAIGILISLLLPILYTYGASLNEKA